jgi:hypothetical protein
MVMVQTKNNNQQNQQIEELRNALQVSSNQKLQNIQKKTSLIKYKIM